MSNQECTSPVSGVINNLTHATSTAQQSTTIPVPSLTKQPDAIAQGLSGQVDMLAFITTALKSMAAHDSECHDNQPVLMNPTVTAGLQQIAEHLQLSAEQLYGDYVQQTRCKTGPQLKVANA
jgi:hypothetical protein